MRTLTPWFVKIWIFFLKKNPFLNFFSKMLNFPKKIVTQKCNKIVRQVVFQNCVSYKWGFFKYSIFGQIFDYYDNRTRLFGISNRLDSYSTIWYSSYSYSTKMVLAHSLPWIHRQMCQDLFSLERFGFWNSFETNCSDSRDIEFGIGRFISQRRDTQHQIQTSRS